MSSRGYCKSRMKISTKKILSKHNDVLLKFAFFSARQLTSQLLYFSILVQNLHKHISLFFRFYFHTNSVLLVLFFF